jgi:hypothetical protein
VRGAIAHHYKATIRPTIDDAAWASAPPIAKQAAVGATLQTVDDYARASAAAGGFDRGEAHLTRTNLRLDGKGWQAAEKACQKLLTELAKIEDAAARRIDKDPKATGTSDAAVVVMLFESIRLSGEEPPPKAKRRRRARASAA